MSDDNTEQRLQQSFDRDRVRDLTIKLAHIVEPDGTSDPEDDDRPTEAATEFADAIRLMNSGIVAEGILEGLRQVYLYWFIQHRELLEDERQG